MLRIRFYLAFFLLGRLLRSSSCSRAGLFARLIFLPCLLPRRNAASPLARTGRARELVCSATRRSRVHDNYRAPLYIHFGRASIEEDTLHLVRGVLAVYHD